MLPVSAPEIARGTVVVANGKIVAVGPDGSVTIPAGARRVNATGKWIVPGIVDTHSHVGGPAGADSSGPLAPEVRVVDSVNPRSPGFLRAAAGGVTTLNVMPGSGHLMSGQTIYLKNRRDPSTIADLAIVDPKRPGRFLGGMKMANGTNSIRTGGGAFPGTRGKSAALVRDLFVRAKKWMADPKREPDEAMESLAEILRGERIVHHHTHRADDIATVLRLKKEFGFRVVLHHASEAALAIDAIAEDKTPCSIIMLDSPGGKLEAMGISPVNGAALEARGVPIALHSDDGITDSRLLFRNAAFMVRGGMSRAGALRALTLSGAEMLDLAERTGSLTPGKDADFVLLSGDPFALMTKVEQTWVDGRKVFDRDDPKDRLAATGGLGNRPDVNAHTCCALEAGE